MSFPRPSVIPAQAGIQWKTQDLGIRINAKYPFRNMNLIENKMAPGQLPA